MFSETITQWVLRWWQLPNASPTGGGGLPNPSEVQYRWSAIILSFPLPLPPPWTADYGVAWVPEVGPPRDWAWISPPLQSTRPTESLQTATESVRVTVGLGWRSLVGGVWISFRIHCPPTHFLSLIGVPLWASRLFFSSSRFWPCSSKFCCIFEISAYKIQNFELKKSNIGTL